VSNAGQGAAYFRLSASLSCRAPHCLLLLSSSKLFRRLLHRLIRLSHLFSTSWLSSQANDHLPYRHCQERISPELFADRALPLTASAGSSSFALRDISRNLPRPALHSVSSTKALTTGNDGNNDHLQAVGAAVREPPSTSIKRPVVTLVDQRSYSFLAAINRCSLGQFMGVSTVTFRQREVNREAFVNHHSAVVKEFS
jgi:hypothetical protein